VAKHTSVLSDRAGWSYGGEDWNSSNNGSGRNSSRGEHRNGFSAQVVDQQTPIQPGHDSELSGYTDAFDDIDSVFSD
jgi:hypothetical protein